MRALAIALLLAWGLADAEPSHLVPVTLRSDPPYATVTDQFGQRLGVTGQTFQLDVNAYGKGALIEFNLSLPGHKPLLISADAQKLESYASSVHHLEPLTQWVAIQDFATRYRSGLVVLGLTLLAGGAALGRIYRRGQAALERERKIQEMAERSPSADSLLATVVGDHLLVEVMGRGGMATVYRGVPKGSLDETKSVAVKVMGRHQALEAKDWERFKREVQISQSLNHRGIVQLMNYGTHQQYLYMVMELVRGQTLRDWIANHQPLPVGRAWAILERIFDAVAYAHDRGVVHRDLKPENIMIDGNDGVHILDFGLAKAMNSEKLTATGSVMGTPLYISPEQIQGGALDPRTDQYSLGVMCYEILSGHLPFYSDDTLKLIMQHLQDPPDPPSRHWPDLEPIDAVLLRMLTKQPEQRFSDLRAALELLGQSLRRGKLIE